MTFTLATMIAQTPVNRSPGDTLGPWAVISFEEPCNFLVIPSIPQNIWQVGAPHKTIFSQAFTPPNAIVTDTMNPYPAGNLSYFELKIGYFNSMFYPHDIFVDFRHKINTDTLADGGYITVSWDNGSTWTNIISDQYARNHFFASPSRPAGWSMWGNNGLYDSLSVLSNGQPGFSGNSNGWLHSCMAWYDLPVDGWPPFPPDTMRLRFNFVSDNLNTGKEGWMIDEIRLYAIDLGSATEEIRGNDPGISVTPNPVQSCASIKISGLWKYADIRILSPDGAVQRQFPTGYTPEIRFDKGNLIPGVYILDVSLDGRAGRVYRMVVMP